MTRGQEIVQTWWDIAREGVEAHHCQHGTTCVEAGGLDIIDLSALAIMIDEALATPSNLGRAQEAAAARDPQDASGPPAAPAPEPRPQDGPTPA